MSKAKATRGHASEVLSAHEFRERALLALVFVAVGVFDVWTVRSSGDPWNGARSRRTIIISSSTAARRQLAMKIDVPDALLKLPDPTIRNNVRSDSAARRVVYHGDIFSIRRAPVVTLMLPFAC